MSCIDELIDRLAPEDVQMKALGDVGEFIRGNGLQKSDLTDEGTPAIHYGQIHTHYGVWADSTKSFTNPKLAAKLRRAQSGDLIVVTTSEDDAAVAKATAWLGDNEVAVSGDAYIFHHTLDPRYVSYFFQSEHFQYQKKRYISGTKVRRISGVSLAKIRIPVPPCEVQREIVRVLDQFTLLETELEAELEARRRQYEHYRRELLISDDDVVRWARLGDVADFRRGTAITAKTAVPGGVRVIANGPDSTYSHNASNRDGETLVIARSGAYAGLVSFWRGPIFLTDAFSVHPKADVLSPKFAFHLLQARQTQLHAFKAGAGVPHVRVKDVEAYEVPIPNLSEQDRIVEILDMFDALVNDLSIGLPAELAARRKQYEYYRDRLLTFEEAVA